MLHNVCSRPRGLNGGTKLCSGRWNVLRVSVAAGLDKGRCLCSRSALSERQRWAIREDVQSEQGPEWPPDNGQSEGGGCAGAVCRHRDPPLRFQGRETGMFEEDGLVLTGLCWGGTHWPAWRARGQSGLGWSVRFLHAQKWWFSSPPYTL